MRPAGDDAALDQGALPSEPCKKTPALVIISRAALEAEVASATSAFCGDGIAD